MRLRTKVWGGIIFSIAVSTVIGGIALSLFHGINQDIVRSQRCNAIIVTALNLNNLIDGFRAEPSRRILQQAGDVRGSMERLLAGASSGGDAREEAILTQLRGNNGEIGPLLDQFYSQAGPASDIESERRHMLATQLVIKVRFLTDDAARLLHISEDRIEAARSRIVVLVVLLIGLPILANAAISYASSRRVVHSVVRLAEGARRVASGDLGHRVEVAGADELADLAATFNIMTGSLADSRDSLDRHAYQLEQKNLELQDFLYIASHDLQEPLRKIQAFGQRLRDEFFPALGEDGRDYLWRMERAATRMQTLIQDLLGYSRVTSRPQPFELADLGEVAGEAALDLDRKIEQTGGVIDVGELPAAEIDRTQMRQVFQNLFANALKYHGAEPPLIRVSGEVAAQDGPERVRVLVRDNGIGFDERHLDRIFKPFQRLHGKNAYEGTGIGLAIVRKIVERHGGTVTAESRPGAGSTFIIELPRRHRDAIQTRIGTTG